MICSKTNDYKKVEMSILPNIKYEKLAPQSQILLRPLTIKVRGFTLTNYQSSCDMRLGQSFEFIATNDRHWDESVEFGSHHAVVKLSQSSPKLV